MGIGLLAIACLAMASLHLFNNIGFHLYIWSQLMVKRGYQVLTKLDLFALLDFSTLFVCSLGTCPYITSTRRDPKSIKPSNHATSLKSDQVKTTSRSYGSGRASRHLGNVTGGSLRDQIRHLPGHFFPKFSLHHYICTIMSADMGRAVTA
jgi:hypothetical protein